METAAVPSRRIYKSRRNRFIDGVCGGIAEYFGVDPTIVRLLWVLVTLLGGSGIVLYIVGMIVMPVNPEHLAGLQPSTTAASSSEPSDRRRFFGILLMLAGMFFLLANLGWFTGFGWWAFSRSVVFPVFLILVGALFIYTYSVRQQPVPTPAGTPPGEGTGAGTAPQASTREFRRSITDRKLFGVCGGLAKYFNVDSTIVRFVFVFMVLGSFGWALVLYIILGIVVQEEKLIPLSGEPQ